MLRVINYIITWLYALPNWIRLILNWIEIHSTFVNIVFKIVCGLIGIIGAGLFYYFKFYRKQKSAALFNFYIRLDMLLSVLKQQIDRTEESKNPFLLLYTGTTMNLLGLSLLRGDESQTEALFLPIAKEIKKLLLDTDNNVYPKTCKKESWYQSQKTLLDFVFMMTDKLGISSIEVDPTAIKRKNGTVIAPEEATVHINKWEKLKEAVQILQDTLREVRY